MRRASLAAAVAAGRFAERYGITRERGYTLGLLHCIGYADLFEIVREMNLPAGPFRGALLETYRPAVGRSRAEIWGLPRDFEAVLSDDGTDPSAAAAVVRIARGAVARLRDREPARRAHRRARGRRAGQRGQHAVRLPRPRDGRRRPGIEPGADPGLKIFLKNRTLRNPGRLPRAFPVP